jgi:formyltetrahydrofolate deformylase
VTSFLIRKGCDISEHQQFDDQAHGQLFLRTSFTTPSPDFALQRLCDAFGPVAEAFGMRWQLRDAAHRPRVLIMVKVRPLPRRPALPLAQ